MLFVDTFYDDLVRTVAGDIFALLLGRSIPAILAITLLSPLTAVFVYALDSDKQFSEHLFF